MFGVELLCSCCDAWDPVRVCIPQAALAAENTKEDLRVQFAQRAAAFKNACDARSSELTALDGRTWHYNCALHRHRFAVRAGILSPPRRCHTNFWLAPAL
jgi:hypothetical protein